MTRQPASSEPVRRSTVRLSRLESILQYVETGTLPWYAEPETADLGHVRELEETAVSDLTAVLQHLPTTPAEAAVFLFRLLSLLPDSGWLLGRARGGAAPAPSGGAGVGRRDRAHRGRARTQQRPARTSGTGGGNHRRLVRPRRTAESAAVADQDRRLVRRAAAVRSTGPADAIGEADRQSAATVGSLAGYGAAAPRRSIARRGAVAGARVLRRPGRC